MPDRPRMTIDQLERTVKAAVDEPLGGTLYTPEGDVQKPNVTVAKKKDVPPKKKQKARYTEPKLKAPSIKKPKVPSIPLMTPRRPTGLVIVVIAALIVLTGGLVVVPILKGASTEDPLKVTTAQQPIVPLSGEAIENTLRVYRKAGAQLNQVTSATPGVTVSRPAIYTLTDQSGVKIAEATAGEQNELLTPVGSDNFLFVDNSGDKTVYSLFNKDGFVALNGTPDSMQDNTAISGNRPYGLSSFGKSSVAYQYCKDAIETLRRGYNCDLRVYNFAEQRETVAPLPAQLKAYQPRLLTFSSDRKSAYFIGQSEESRNKLQQDILSITDGKQLSRGSSAAKDVYALRVKRVILKLDLASQTLSEVKPVETEYTYYDRFWLSPDGKHLVYSNAGEDGYVHYINVANQTAESIVLPKTYASEPWGGRTTTYDPQFSPDGKYMAYVTYDAQYSDKFESFGIIDFATSTATEYAKQPNDATDTTTYFTNLRWVTANQIELRQGRDNYRYVPTTSVGQKIDDSNGLLVGITDGSQ